MKTNYSMIIQWSDIDQIFVVSIPEFAGRISMPCTEGNSYEDAAQAGLEVIETFLEIWEEEGKSIPEPRSLEELVAA
jgi:predicted RNase H-like HicB family nuclease